VNQLLERLGKDFKDEDNRYVYADTVTNAFVSAQIKALKEDRKLSQAELAELIGTQQSGISRLLRLDYSAWQIETLRKLARAFGVRLRISFEEFGTLMDDVSGFNKKNLLPRKFEDDPAFKEAAREPKPEEAAATAKTAPKRLAETKGNDLSWLGNSLEVATKVITAYAKLGRVNYLGSSQTALADSLTKEPVGTLVISVNDSVATSESLSETILMSAPSVSDTEVRRASFGLIQGGRKKRRIQHKQRTVKHRRIRPERPAA